MMSKKEIADIRLAAIALTRHGKIKEAEMLNEIIAAEGHETVSTIHGHATQIFNTDTCYPRLRKLIKAVSARTPVGLDKGSKPIYDFTMENCVLMGPDVLIHVVHKTITDNFDDMNDHCHIEIPQAEDLRIADAVWIFESLDPEWDGWVF